MPSCVISTETVGSAKAEIFISGFKQKTGLFVCFFIKNVEAGFGGQEPCLDPIRKRWERFLKPKSYPSRPLLFFSVNRTVPSPQSYMIRLRGKENKFLFKILKQTPQIQKEQKDPFYFSGIVLTVSGQRLKTSCVASRCCQLHLPLTPFNPRSPRKPGQPFSPCSPFLPGCPSWPGFPLSPGKPRKPGSPWGPDEWEYENLGKVL